MKGAYRRLSKQWIKHITVLLLAGLGADLYLSGGAVYVRLGVCVRPSSASGIDLQKGLIGWWKLDSNTKDSSPYRNTTQACFYINGIQDRC